MAHYRNGKLTTLSYSPTPLLPQGTPQLLSTIATISQYADYSAFSVFNPRWTPRLRSSRRIFSDGLKFHPWSWPTALDCLKP